MAARVAVVCAALALGAVPARTTAGGERAEAAREFTFLSAPDLPPSRLPFRSYGSAQGLTNLAVRRLAQDAAGFLWVATEDGLIRYDGSRFQRFGLEDGLPASWIVALAAPPSGGLWVGTPHGVARLVDDRFAAVGAAEGLPPAPCNGLAVDGGGRVWAALAAGLFVGSAPAGFALAAGWPGGEATAVHVGPAGGEIYAARGGQVAAWRGDGPWRLVELAPGWQDAVDELVVDHDGTLWVQSSRHLFTRAAGAPAFRDVTAELPRVSSRGFIGLDRSHSLWVPTDEGISYRARNSWVSLDPRMGLPTDWSRCMLEDREGSLWVGSLGLHRLIGRGLWASWTRAEGLASDVIWCIQRDSAGRLWVGTDKGLVQATPGGWRALPGSEQTVVHHVWEDPGGALWLSCVPAAVRRYDPRSGAMVRFGREAGVTGRRVLCVRGDGAGELWVATDGAGLLRFDPARRRFVREMVPDDAPAEAFRFLLVDRRGRLWAPGENGLLCREAGRWRRFTRRDGLARNHVAYLAETASGDLWIAYFESIGIARIRVADDRLEVLERRDRGSGLGSDKAYLLGEDRLGGLWVGTGNGADLITPRGTLHFSQGEGLAGNDCDAMAFLAEPQGRVFLGTSSGLSLFLGSPEPLPRQPPWARVLSVRLGGEPRFPGCPQPLAVAHDESTFEVSFAGLSFVNEDHVQHEVRLVGLEPAWRRSQVREARYARLPPGSYRFEARARLAGGEWSDPASFAFVVGKPWWETWPARLLAAALVAAALVMAVRARVGRLRRRTRELEATVAARTRELAEANRVLAEVSVTDPLTGSKNRRFLTLSLPEEVARVVRAYRLHQEKRLSGTPANSDLLFLLVDIDHFKEVNDSHGHEAGDRLLQQVRERLTRAARSSDSIVRWGGEEFLVVARGCERDEAAMLAARIHAAVGGEPFALGDGHEIRRNCCVGFASLPFLRGDPDAFTWEDVVNVADRCMYAAKRSGRNAWVGVTTADTLTRASWPARSPTDLAAAAATGGVEILTSLPSAAHVRWD